MIRRTIRTGLFSIAAFAMTATLALAQSHTSKPFSGAKVNAGTVTHSMKDGKDVLTLSDDFKVPDTPDPHWQVVDSKGNTYLLQRLGAKSLGGLAKDRINMSITLPALHQGRCQGADLLRVGGSGSRRGAVQRAAHDDEQVAHAGSRLLFQTGIGSD